MSSDETGAGEVPDRSPEESSKPELAPEQPYEASYSETGFRDKLNRFAREAGRELVEKALWLYYASQQPETPAWAKATVYTALGYFILPSDAVPDITPVVGFGDDLGAISLALATIAAYVTPKVKAQAEARMQDWFGDKDS